MRRIVLIALTIVGASALAVVSTGAKNNDPGNYKVRAIFDNAVSVIPGEDVKIAGVKVGKVDSLDVTDNDQAAITLAVTEPGFQDFRQDATCTIRPQSLIGEKYVECSPTQPRPVGQPRAPELVKIAKGRGKGQRLLPIQTKYGGGTRTPVDIDLINNVFRLPYAQRFSLILNELGAGLAGRGQDLNSAIKRANPAFLELDRVLAILARQNKTLADLARDSDTGLAPVARERKRLGDFIDKAGNTAAATAERRVALERQFQLFPTFLRELRPTLVRLSGLAGQMTPVLNDLRGAAPGLNRFITQLGPFAEASRPAIRSLGAASVVGSQALPAVDPLITLLAKFAKPAAKLGTDLEALLTSVKQTGGVERLMDYLFYQVAAINGFDSIGRFLRAGLIVNTCSSYAIEPVSGCSANFVQNTGARSAGSGGLPSAEGRDPRLVALDRVLRGEPAAQVLAGMGLPTVSQEYSQPADKRAGGTPTQPPSTDTQQPSNAPASTPAQGRQVAPSGGGGQAGTSGSSDRNAANGLFDYLLGSGK